MSKLSKKSIHTARNGEDESGQDAPVDVVVKDLDVTRLELAWRFLRLRYKHRGVGLAEDEAFFALPLKFMSKGTEVHDWSKHKRMPQYSLFPFEAPFERQYSGGLELNDGVRVVQLECLVLARCIRRAHGGEEALG